MAKTNTKQKPKSKTDIKKTTRVVKRPAKTVVKKLKSDKKTTRVVKRPAKTVIKKLKSDKKPTRVVKRTTKTVKTKKQQQQINCEPCRLKPSKSSHSNRILKYI